MNANPPAPAPASGPPPVSEVGSCPPTPVPVFVRLVLPVRCVRRSLPVPFRAVSSYYLSTSCLLPETSACQISNLKFNFPRSLSNWCSFVSIRGSKSSLFRLRPFRLFRPFNPFGPFGPFGPFPAPAAPLPQACKFHQTTKIYGPNNVQYRPKRSKNVRIRPKWSQNVPRYGPLFPNFVHI